MLGNRLKKLRLQKKLTQEELAEKLGITRGTYAHYEINKRQPDYETLQKLADFFNVSVDYLLGRTDDPYPYVPAYKLKGELRHYLLSAMEIGSRVRILRESKGLSARQLAEAASLDPTQISKIENGKSTPSLQALERICNVLGIKLSEFFSDESSSLSPDLLQLLENAKKLPPAERKALNEYLKVRLSYIDETSAAESVILEQEEKYAGDKVASIPLVGASAAGTPMTAIGYYEGNFEVPRDWGDFAVRVRGDSMEPLIPNGGYAFIRQQEEINNGEIALVKTAGEYEDEVTIKRVRFLNGKVQLISENPAYEPMIYDMDRIKILGKVKKWLTAEEGSKYLKEHV